MRKLSLSVVVFAFLAGVFSFYSVAPSCAQTFTIKAGEKCNGDEKDPSSVICGGRAGCSGGRNCEKGKGLTCDGKNNDRICKSLQASEQLKCVCDNLGKNKAGNNGFKCGKDGNVTGQPTIYCNDADNACYPINDTDPKKNLVDDGKISRGSNYAGATLTGVVCQGVKNIAQCTCSGKSSLSCTLDELDPSGRDGKGNEKVGQKATAKCKHSKDYCINAPGEFADMELFEGYTGFLEPDSWANLFGNNSGGIIKGATCGQPPLQCTCVTPGRNGPRVNGFTCVRTVGADSTVQKDLDFCKDSSEACIQKDPNFIMTQETADGIFKDSVLKGVDCQVKPREAPPKPPCANKQFDNEGRCLAFDTAFGAINTDAGAFITSLFGLLLSFSGGIALLLIMRAGYILLTSAGKPDKVTAGREQLIAAIVGLLFIIFSSAYY